MHFCLFVSIKRSKTYAFLTARFVSELALILQHSGWWKHLNSRQYLGEHLIKKDNLQERSQNNTFLPFLCSRRPCVWDTVVEMRTARPKMVQKREQYLYIYSCLLDFINSAHERVWKYFRKYMFDIWCTWRLTLGAFHLPPPSVSLHTALSYHMKFLYDCGK